MSEFKSHKALILRNIFWGNLNTIARYSLAFVATSLLARGFSPDVFGTYQLVISYLAIFEGFFFVSPTHLRNYLAAHPERESVVNSLWFWQNLIIFLSLLVICSISYKFSDEPMFWALLALASIRLLLRYNDYVSIVCDQRLLNHLAQQVSIVQSMSLNILRILAAVLKTNIFWLCLTSPLQGLCSVYQQHRIAKKVGIHLSVKVDYAEFLKIFKGGFFISLLSFFSIFQSRLISLVLAEYLSKDNFGNFQLVVKLIEPATMLGVIIIGANYSVLANSLHSNVKLFNLRFLKIAGMTLGISTILAFIIYLSPVSLLQKFFGSQYLHGLELLKIGSLLVIANTFFWIDQNYDFLKQDYIFALVKYVVMLGLYMYAVIYFNTAITIETGLWIAIIVPFVISGISLLYRTINYFKSI